MRFAVTSVVFLFLLCSCGAMQDVGYLRNELKNGGDPQQVKEQLLALRDAGYLEADWALADLDYENGSLEDLRRACDYFRTQREVSEKAATRYAKCLARMSYQDATYREEAHQALIERYRQSPDVAPDLAKFYSYYADLYDPAELEKIIAELQQDPENAGLILRIIFQGNHPEQYADYLSQICDNTQNEELKPLCTLTELKIAKIEKNETKLSEIVKKLSERYSDIDKTGLSESDEEMLYRSARLLLNDEVGTRHLTDGLNIAGLGKGQSEKLFLLIARYEHKRKYMIPTEELVDGLEKLAKNNCQEAAIMLGEMYAEGYRMPDDPVVAEKYLLPLSTSPSAALFLGRLYLSGKLGPQKMQDGVDLILFAARNGEGQGYIDLAKAFNGHPGIKANPEYAWVFSKISAEESKNPEVTTELQKIAIQLAGEMGNLSQSKKLLHSECEHMSDAMSFSVCTSIEKPNTLE